MRRRHAKLLAKRRTRAFWSGFWRRKTDATRAVLQFCLCSTPGVNPEERNLFCRLYTDFRCGGAPHEVAREHAALLTAQRVVWREAQEKRLGEAVGQATEGT